MDGNQAVVYAKIIRIRLKLKSIRREFVVAPAVSGEVKNEMLLIPHPMAGVDARRYIVTADL